MNLKKIVVLGCGTMGQQIAIQFAASGFDVTIYDSFENSLEKGKKRIPKLAGQLIDLKRLSKEKVDQGLKRIKFTADKKEAAHNADFINESVPEDPKIKAEIFSEFNKLCPDHTIFTTNTSTLLPSMFAKDTGRPEKFAALHFHDLFLTNLVDIMPHPETSKETIEIIKKVCETTELFPIELKKETNGYVFNAMLSQLLGAALSLASSKTASHQDIDRSWMGVMQNKIGPFGIMDSIGLETMWRVTDYWAKVSKNPQGERNAKFLKEFIDKGDLGIKTNKGFYEYPDPEYLKPEFLHGIK